MAWIGDTVFCLDCGPDATVKCDSEAGLALVESLTGPNPPKCEHTLTDGPMQDRLLAYWGTEL
jgi:hypothetical protein